MADVDTFIGIGNSNGQALAYLSGVPAADLSRWLGLAIPVTYPSMGLAEGVQIYTTRQPYGISDTRNITAVGGSTLTFSGAVLNANQIDSWVFIRTNSTGQGQHARIQLGTGTNILTTVFPWAPAISADGTMDFMTDSHTVTSATTTVITKIGGTTPDFTTGTTKVGRWVVFLSGTQILVSRKIVAQTADTITLDNPLAFAPAVGVGFRIMTGTNSAETIASYASGAAIRDLTFSYDTAITYSTGFEYPNFKNRPLSGPAVETILPTINYVPELTWQLRSKSQQKVYFLPFNISGATLAPNYVGATDYAAALGWQHDITHLDYHPASPSGLYSVLIAAISSFASLIALQGNTINIRGFFTIVVGNDARDANRAAKVGENMALLRDSLRSFVQTNNYSRLQAKRIAWIMANDGSTTLTERATTNAALAQIAADDTYSGIVDATGPKYTYLNDLLHLDALGEIQLGKDFFTSYSAVIARESSAARIQSELPTLAVIRTRVKRRYQRNQSSNDATSAQLDMFINDSLNEIYRGMGENAWFLRRVETVTISQAYPGTVTLPRVVLRLLRVERSSSPGIALVTHGISYTDEGRTQIALHDGGGGPYNVHFIAKWQDLVADSDVALLPIEHIELIFLLACKRLTECSGNATMANYYAAESMRLWRDLKREGLRYDRFRNGQLEVLGAYDSWRNGSSTPWTEGL